MIARVVLVLALATLVGVLLGGPRLPPPVTAQDLLPTPAGQLGGREDLPTASGMPTEAPPAPDGRPLAGAWSLEFADEDRAPARLVLAADGLAGFVDGDGNRGAGVWAETGPRRGVLAVSIRAADGPAGAAGITLLQGTITAGPGNDAAALTYTTAMVDELGISAGPDGPFRATAQRADEA